MAVYTRINDSDLGLIEKTFDIGRIVSFSGIKKGIENTNYLIKTNKKKIILTIFERRVQKKDLPFFMDLMFSLSKQKIKRAPDVNPITAGITLTNPSPSLI